MKSLKYFQQNFFKKLNINYAKTLKLE